MTGCQIKYTELTTKGPLLVLVGGVNTYQKHWQLYIDLLKNDYKILLVELLPPTALNYIPVHDVVSHIAGKIKAYTGTVHMMTYSIGARLAFCLIEDTEIPWGNIIAIAPDGMRRHPVFIIATHAPGSIMFRYSMHHPMILSHAAWLLHKMGIVSTYYYYIIRELSTRKDQCANLYNQWMLFSHIKPLHKKRAATITYQLYVLFGARDKTIPPALARRALQLYPNANIRVVNSTHKLSSAKYIYAVKNILLP